MYMPWLIPFKLSRTSSFFFLNMTREKITEKNNKKEKNQFFSASHTGIMESDLT